MLLDLLTAAGEDNFAQEYYLIGGAQVPALQDLFAQHLPHIKDHRAALSMQTGTGVIVKGDLLQICIDGTCSVGVLMFCISGNCVATGSLCYFAAVEYCLRSTSRTWKPSGNLAIFDCSNLGGALAYVKVADGLQPLKRIA